MYLKPQILNYTYKYDNLIILNFFSFILLFFFYKQYYIFFKYFIYNNLKMYKTKFLVLHPIFYFFNLNLYNFWGSLSFIECVLDGVYYRVKYYKKYNILGFILGYNHYVLYTLPETIKAVVNMKSRRFFLYGYNLKKLSSIAIELVNLKYPNIFKGKGVKVVFIKYRKKILLKKQQKK